MNAEIKEEEEDTITITANKIWRTHAALDSVYGQGFAKDNPDTVARFMQALSTQELADEVGALRELIGNGTGAITVGLEQAAITS